MKLSNVGTYDPIPKPAPLGQGKPFKDIQLDTARAKYWLGVGAQPSDPARRLLAMVSSSGLWVTCFLPEACDSLTIMVSSQIGLLEPRFNVTKMQQAELNAAGSLKEASGVVALEE